jgi:WD40 repeat protein
MSVAGGDHTATVLRNGTVLVAGGSRGMLAELYDPEAGTFMVTGSMIVGRGTSAILLDEGKVLITGGYDGTNFVWAAEVYDPVAGTFTATDGMSEARNRHTATLLPSGDVLIAGGFDGTSSLTSADLYE